jgi:hypothetical protein
MSFKPTFVISVEIKPESTVTAGTGANGQPFASIKEAAIARNGRPDTRQTVVAFGPAASILASLEPSRPVQLAVQHNGGTLRVIGLPRAKIAV